MSSRLITALQGENDPLPTMERGYSMRRAAELWDNDKKTCKQTACTCKNIEAYFRHTFQVLQCSVKHGERPDNWAKFLRACTLLNLNYLHHILTNTKVYRSNYLCRILQNNACRSMQRHAELLHFPFLSFLLLLLSHGYKCLMMRRITTKALRNHSSYP